MVAELLYPVGNDGAFLPLSPTTTTPSTYEVPRINLTLIMAMYTTQEELEALVNDYRRDLERTELLRRQSLTGRPSLIHQLPPEVLLEVFSILLDNDSRNMVFPSHVCRLWRSLITESSWLWTSITLSDYNEDGETVPSYLNTIIQRAKTRRLSLRINSNELLKAVLKVAGKAEWCSISYISDEIEDFIPFFDGSFNVAHVRRLSLSSSRRGTGIFELDLLGGVVDMHPFKQLKSLTLDFPQEVRTNIFLVPWHQLTDLAITAYMDSLHGLSVLRHCINLKNCQLCLDTSEDIERIYHDRVEQDQIRLPSLEQLQLTAIEVPSLVPWKLQCPTLHKAIFNYDDNDCDNASSKLFSFIRSCGTTLRKLYLPGLVTDIFDEIQGDLQALEELTISGPFGLSESLEHSVEEKSYILGIEAFFQSLIDCPKDLPQLKVLRLLDQRIEEKVAMESHVVRFLDFRLSYKDQVSSLQKVIVRLNWQSYRQQNQRRGKCRKWAEQGIQVDFE